MNPPNDLASWLTWIESQHPTEIELGLTRVRSVAERLGVLTFNCPVITIAGTNGKGSTVAFVETALRKSGYMVGTYTSPHFRRFNERIMLGGQMASDEQICDAFAKITQASGDITLTYFEYATLAALVIFNQLPLDYIILEVGLGGRLDAVNIVDADCAAVTSIDLDHMDWLGDDREQIGREKAGVFREDKPAVCGATNTPASIAQVAQEVGANLYQVGEQFSYDSDGDHWDWHGVDAKGQGLTINDIPMPQLPHANALTALQILALMAPDAPAHVLRAAIAEAQVEGRMQKVAPKTLVDVAHNPEAARYLAARITKLGKPVHLVIGMLADKDCASVLETLVPVVKHVYLASLDVPRGQTSEELAQAMPQSSVKPPLHSCFATVPQAIEAATKARQKGERVYIVGSFFTVAQALDYFNYEG